MFYNSYTSFASVVQQINDTKVPFDSLFHVFLSCIYCCPISTGVSSPPSTITTPPFPFLFLSVLPSERPPIGFGGGRRLCRIIMGSSWENCPRKGWPGKKRGGGGNLVLFPILLGNIHQRELGWLRGRSSPTAGAPNRSCHCQCCQGRGERCPPEGHML